MYIHMYTVKKIYNPCQCRIVMAKSLFFNSYNFQAENYGGFVNIRAQFSFFFPKFE